VVIIIIIIVINYFSTTTTETKIKNEHYEYLYNLIESKSGPINLQTKIYYPIYYINMDSNKKRKQFIENQMKKYSIENYTRISGVNIDNFLYEFETDYNLTNHQKGCIASHIMAMKQFIESGNEIAIIMEDDASLSLIPHINFELPMFIEQKVPNDWEIISLSNLLCNNDYNPDICLYERVNKKESCWLTTAYIINKKAAQKFLNLVFKNGTIFINQLEHEFPNHGVADDYIFSLLKTYYISPSIVFQYDPTDDSTDFPLDEYTLNPYINNGFPILNENTFEIKPV
jgi:GR25 family glycosyltransferase involved in LPS biosynthesis